MSSKSEILAEIKETLSSSSIHSFPNIVQNKFKSIKIVWAICFFVSSAACAFYITTAISEFLEYDSVSKTSIKYVSKIDFPIISICDANAFTTEYATEFLTEKLRFNFSDFDFSKSATAIKYDFYTKRYISLVNVKNLL